MMSTLDLLGAILIVLMLTVTVSAQTTLAVDITKASLVWTWTKGTQAGVNDGVPTEWWFYCGTTAGAPNVAPVKLPYVTPTSGTSYSQPVKPLIAGSGTWFCSLVASNQFGQSARTNEVSFTAGTLPVAATGLVIQSQ
jgi:hypothetical protein